MGCLSDWCQPRVSSIPPKKQATALFGLAMTPWSSEIGVKVPVSETDPAPEALEPQDHTVQGSTKRSAPNEGEILQREGTGPFVG